MKIELLTIYNKFSEEKLASFFDELVGFVNENKVAFSKYVTIEFYEAMLKYKSDEFIIGHSDDFFAKGVSYYIENMENFSEEQIVKQVSSLVWSLATYMLDNKVCPNCHESNPRLLISGENNEVYEFCEECLYTTLNGKLVETDEELLPANKQEVLQYLDKLGVD